MARPTKRAALNRKIAAAITKQKPEVLELLRQAFSVDATIEEACFYAGIDDSTYYLWKKKNPKDFEELERLRLNPILKARQTIVQSLNDPQRAQWYLERKRKLEFSQRTETDVTTLGEKIESTHDISALAAEAARLLKEKKL